MESEGSLLCSQQLSTGTCPEPDKYILYHPILSKIHFNIMIASLGLGSGLLPYRFPTKILYTFLFSPMRATFPVHIIVLN
jgi:hypothetical protein